ncbi:hypothetical protein [Mesorhizobium sp.]|uniref:hypothetical protein n=1 Tax=Mesorhizobium sp. TaxID=1871066 RepID=UPI000FE9D1B8|nr:hypothetical protein [Mesorhizobium sp.]RWN58741.1 MAG: hypothetical protein EOS00_20340 [Mesorhizobium sp.]
MTRHASLAAQLAALKAAIQRPTEPIEPLKTNWSTVAANDNNPEELVDKRVERRWSIRPTLSEIEREIEDGETTYGFHVDESGKKHKITVAIGNLQFSDGTATEKAYTYGPDGKVVMDDVQLPVGAMLKTKEAQERTLGGDGILSSSGIYTKIYKARHPGEVKRRDPELVKRERAEAQPRTKTEMRQELADAVARTVSLPTTKVYPPGFPWQASNLRELFMGVEKGRKGESGSIAWQDISTHVVEREVWAETIASLSNEDKVTLRGAETAASLSDFGGSGHRRTRERRGKTRLLALNDNIQAAYKKSAA